MSYTKFGEFVRLLRVKNHEVMGDMARMLATSTSNLSAVENGKKNVPKNWIPKIVDYYHLSEEEEHDLIESIEESKTHSGRRRFSFHVRLMAWMMRRLERL